MKRLFLTLALPLLALMSVMAMSDGHMRETARFLTDRMAYELQLTPAQYEDCFEVNYDFIYAANELMDDVVRGYSDAIDSYYDYLDYRNEDLRYILNATQFGLFIGLDYFFRPIYTTARRWAFRVYDVYHNHRHFYYGLPACYHTYHGLHSHHHHVGGYYVNRYTHVHHTNPIHIHRSPQYDTHRHNDFGDRYHHRDNPPHHGNARPNGNDHKGGKDANRGNDYKIRRDQGNPHKRGDDKKMNRGEGSTPKTPHRGGDNGIKHQQRGNSHQQHGEARQHTPQQRPQGSHQQGGRPQSGGSRGDHGSREHGSNNHDTRGGRR